MAIIAGGRCRSFAAFGIAGIDVNLFVTFPAVAVHGVFVNHDVVSVVFVFFKDVVAFMTGMNIISHFEVSQGCSGFVMMTITA